MELVYILLLESRFCGFNSRLAYLIAYSIQRRGLESPATPTIGTSLEYGIWRLKLYNICAEIFTEFKMILLKYNKKSFKMTASQGWLLRHLTSTSMDRGHVFWNMMLMVQVHPGQFNIGIVVEQLPNDKTSHSVFPIYIFF